MRHHPPGRELAIPIVCQDLHLSPNAVLAGARLLQRARVLIRYQRDSWRLVERASGQPFRAPNGQLLRPIAPGKPRWAGARPDRPISLWYAGERLQEAQAISRRGAPALWAWLLAVRDQLAQLADSLAKCKDQGLSSERPLVHGAAERPAGRKPPNPAAHGPPLAAGFSLGQPAASSAGGQPRPRPQEGQPLLSSPAYQRARQQILRLFTTPDAGRAMLSKPSQ